MEIIDNCQTNESTKTLSYKSLSSMCNELYSVTKINNVIYTFIVGMLLEIKEVIMSKKNKNLDLNQMITQFTIKFFTRKCEKN